MTISLLSALAVVSVLVATVAVAIQGAIYRLRGGRGSVAGTRAGRITFLLAAAMSLIAAVLVAIWYANSNPHMLVLAPLAAVPLIGVSVLLIWDVVQPNRTVRRRNAPRSPPHTPCRE